MGERIRRIDAIVREAIIGKRGIEDFADSKAAMALGAHWPQPLSGLAVRNAVDRVRKQHEAEQRQARLGES